MAAPVAEATGSGVRTGRGIKATGVMRRTTVAHAGCYQSSSLPPEQPTADRNCRKWRMRYLTALKTNRELPIVIGAVLTVITAATRTRRALRHYGPDPPTAGEDVGRVDSAAQYQPYATSWSQ